MLGIQINWLLGASADAVSVGVLEVNNVWFSKKENNFHIPVLHSRKLFNTIALYK